MDTLKGSAYSRVGRHLDTLKGPETYGLQVFFLII